MPRLFEELQIAHGDGSFTRRLAQLARIDVLVLDDWGLQEPSEAPAAICWKFWTIASVPARPS
ncbi:hypothetical protein AWV80_00085 [Cupriavidus sp. UYMU48A]|nr:hypothetical protein AWV80_00085 [Cupriavidus sp. UYMU48A]